MLFQQTCGIALLLICALLATAVLAQTISPQCQEAPILIPDTFSTSYQPFTATTGSIYFTYIEPQWENWPMLDIRELASEPFTASFTIDLTLANIEFAPSECTFMTPQSFTRSNPATAVWADTAQTQLKVTFSQTGSLHCPVIPTVSNVQGKQQHSVEGTLTVKTYVCTDGQPNAASIPATLDGASKVSLPDLFTHVPCSRLTLNFESTSQLTLRQTDNLRNDINSLSAMVPDVGKTPITRLHSYTISQVSTDSFGQAIYRNVLAFCTFDGMLDSTFDAGSLFVSGTDLSKVSYSIKSSKIPSYCFDGKKNFDESDVDCGGSGKLNGCPACLDSSQLCSGNADCVSGQCLSHQLAGKRCLAFSSASSVTVSVFILALALVAALF